LGQSTLDVIKVDLAVVGHETNSHLFLQKEIF
jgi:hypothetical protein